MIKTTYSAESWEKVYTAFNAINFTAYDYDTIKESLLQYLQVYHFEDYNDFIESSEFLALLEIFAYAAELIAYRADAVAHENFISTAQRKESILRLAKLISYSTSRNIPVRGLVKINSIRTSESVFDSLGNDLANRTITWNDPNNTNWKEQFFLVINLVMTSRFGQPSRSNQIADVLMQQYTFNNTVDSFVNGVFSYSASSSAETVNMEIVPASIDDNGPKEREPDPYSQMNILYATDGRGDGSDYTGFLMFTKQGSMVVTQFEISEPIANRRMILNQENVNDTDVWVYQVNDANRITQKWVAVPNLADNTLSFNTLPTRFKYEIETLENDRIALVFGDGNFSDVPLGKFQLWTRTSTPTAINIPKNRVSNEPMSFRYVDRLNNSHTCTVSFSLTAALQNNSPTESLEHIRQAAPATYYAQNRMVNGQDYNTFMLRDSSILKLHTINRTFAGQPKYLEWNDASGAYQNIKLYGDDLTMGMNVDLASVSTATSAKGLIDSYLEPVLASTGMLNTLVYLTDTATDNIDDYVGYGIISYPRRKFIEDNRKIYKTIEDEWVTPYGRQLDSSPLQIGDGSLLEKTVIQGALDEHWYGEPSSTVSINGVPHGLIPDPILNPSTSGRYYIHNLPRTIDGQNSYPPGDIGPGLQQISSQQYFGLKFNRFLKGIGDGQLTLVTNVAAGLLNQRHKVETLTVEMLSDGTTFSVISNIRGRLPNYSLVIAASGYEKWSEQTTATLPVDFTIEFPTVPFEAGDAFIIDVAYNNAVVNPTDPLGWKARVRPFGTNGITCVNLSGWWELIPAEVVNAAGLFVDGADNGPDEVQKSQFDPHDSGLSWVFLVSKISDINGEVIRWNIFNRDMKIIVSSPTTKFWFNQDSQIIDNETRKPLYDKLRILRSNLDEAGVPLTAAHIYDCVGFVYDNNGEPINNSLEILPTDIMNFTQAGDGTPDNILQFQNFARSSYRYVLYRRPTPTASPEFVKILQCADFVYTGYDINPYDSGRYDYRALMITGVSDATVELAGALFEFERGGLVATVITTDTGSVWELVREIYVPSTISMNGDDPECREQEGLDFMWQHYTPQANLIDPSVSNIHDTYLLTQGYYTNMTNYVRGITNIPPAPPTPLDLRTTYGYLLENKMLSDTVVLHPAKIKLLFGSLAEQQLRAKFRTVMSPTATISSERVKQEIINVVNRYFDISNWDFGDTFYATELLSLIHQALPTQISSVVLVPTYSVNSFGSLFTIQSSIDEVLQSCASIDDVEIVPALTPTVLRQSSS